MIWKKAFVGVFALGLVCTSSCNDDDSGSARPDASTDVAGRFLPPDAAASDAKPIAEVGVLDASADLVAGDAAVADASADAMPMSQLDPAPGFATPGIFTTDGSPTSNIETFERILGNATKEDFSGTTLGALGDGVFYIVKVTNADGSPVVGVSELSGLISTALDGSFSFTAPLFCGTQLVKFVWSNATGRTVVVTRVSTSNCVEPDIRLTISWDSKGFDWELHLIKPGGKINDNATDCTWTSCLGVKPDWGVKGDASDDPSKDVDDTGNFGPENIVLSKPETGVYTVMVEHWGAGEPSSGQAVINVKGKVTVVPLVNFIKQHVRTVATIDWPSQSVNVLNTDLDCAASWSRGCTASIP